MGGNVPADVLTYLLMPTPDRTLSSAPIFVIIIIIIVIIFAVVVALARFLSFLLVVTVTTVNRPRCLRLAKTQDDHPDFSWGQPR